MTQVRFFLTPDAARREDGQVPLRSETARIDALRGIRQAVRDG
jgi:hypothetical protein